MPLRVVQAIHEEEECPFCSGAKGTATWHIVGYKDPKDDLNDLCHESKEEAEAELLREMNEDSRIELVRTRVTAAIEEARANLSEEELEYESSINTLLRNLEETLQEVELWKES